MTVTAPPFLLYIVAIFLSVSISIMEIGLGLLLLLLVIYVWQNKINVLKDNSYMIPFLLYWFATICSVIFGSPLSEKVGGLVAIWGLLFFFTGYYFVYSSSIRLIFVSLVLGGLVLSCSVFYDYFVLSLPRPAGFLNMYISSANILVILAILSLAIIITGYEKGKVAVFYGVSIVILLLAAVVTGTRGALLAFVATVGLMFVVKYKLKGLIYSGILLAVVVVISIFSGISDRFIEIVEAGVFNENTSHGWRFVLWKGAFELFKDYPIFGIGEGAFEPLIRDIIPKSDFATGHPHNGFINILVTYGIFGLIAFCYFYGKITIDLAKKIYVSKYAFMGFFVMVAFFVESLTEDNFSDGETKMITIFIAGLLLGAIRKGIKDTGIDNKISFHKNI